MEPERTGLNIRVAQYMIKVEPEARKSAPGCIEMLDQASDNDNNTTSQGHQKGSFSNASSSNTQGRSDNGVLTRKLEPSEEQDLGTKGKAKAEDNESLGG